MGFKAVSRNKIISIIKEFGPVHEAEIDRVLYDSHKIKNTSENKKIIALLISENRIRKFEGRLEGDKEDYTMYVMPSKYREIMFFRKNLTVYLKPDCKQLARKTYLSEEKIKKLLEAHNEIKKNN